MAFKHREEERRRLLSLIQEWNLNRVELFSLSEPNENLEFFGVMRFYYRDEGEKYNSKCIRVSSTASTGDVIETLVEKFRPDMRMLINASYSLYVTHPNGDERKLLDHDKPLLVQLNWGKDDRDGRFLLKKEVERNSSLGRLSSSTGELSTVGSSGSGGGSFKRKLSKREKKEQKKKEKEEKMKQLASRGGGGADGSSEGRSSSPGVAEKLYSELPESSFTRSISNPELVMRKRRQLKLERKLLDMNAPNGTQGGTLKIYGQSIKPDVPYKTLLLTVNDTAADVVAEALEKYGYEKEDPDQFCLVMVMIPPEGMENNKDLRERILDDDECPLNILLQHPPSKALAERMTMSDILSLPGGDWLIKFHLRMRPPDSHAKRIKNKNRATNQNYYPTDSLSSNDIHVQQQQQQQRQQQQQQQQYFLVPIGPDGRELMNADPISVPYGVLEIGSERNHQSSVPFIYLPSSDIHPLHCTMTRSAGGTTWIAPSDQESAVVFVQNRRIRVPTQVAGGDVLQVGRSYFFRFLDGRVPPSIQNSNYVNNNNNINTAGVLSNNLLARYNGSNNFGNNNSFISNASSFVGDNNNGFIDNSHLRSPSSSSSSRTSNSRLAKNDLETTFDLDGQVLTVPSHVPAGGKGYFSDDGLGRTAYGDRGSIYQQLKARPAQSENQLPVDFAIREGYEEQFLRDCISEVNFGTMQFKTSPAFLLYAAARSMLGSTPANEGRLVGFLARASQLVAKSLKENAGHPPLLSFWLANCSELKNFLCFDPRLSRPSTQAQNTLMEVTQVAFASFIDCLRGELEQTLPAIVSAGPDAGDMEVVEDFMVKRVPPKLGNVTHVLTLAMSVLRKCRVNTTVTIYIFSELFAYIGSWVFNCVVMEQRLRLCTASWGRILRLRLQQVILWAERQGLEKAAECHLAKAMQLCMILECRKSDLLQVLPSCDLINSIQLRAVLSGYLPAEGEQPMPREVAEKAVRVAASTVDYDIAREGGVPQLAEPLDRDFRLDEAFPTEGFGCDTVVGVQPGMMEFAETFNRSGAGIFSLNPNSSGSWSVHLDRGRIDGEMNQMRAPEVIPVTLNKIRNSLGLSIVAAQGDGQKEKGIYVRSVVPSGAADLDGRIQTGDQLLEVGGRSLVGVTQERAAEMMSQSGQVVNLKILKRAATHHGIKALLESAQPDPSVQKQQQQQTIMQRVQDQPRSLVPGGPTRGEDPYGRPLQPSFQSKMTGSQSDPDLLHPGNSHPSFPKDPSHHPPHQRFVTASESSSDVAHRDIQSRPTMPQNAKKDQLIYGRLGHGRSDSPMSFSGVVQFPDAPPIKFNPAASIAGPARPSSALQNPNRGPGYATQMLFPKAVVPSLNGSSSSLQSLPSSRSRLQPASNADYLVASANQSSTEIYQSKSQLSPPRTGGEQEFPPPPPDVQLARLKVSGLPRPFETLGEAETSSVPQASEVVGKKPPPVATKPKIAPADLKLAKSPWEKEAKEREEEEQAKKRRRDEISRLANKPYLSQEEQSRLNRLRTEEEFDRRALQASTEDCRTPTGQFPSNLTVIQKEQPANSGVAYISDERQQPQNYGQLRPNMVQFEPPRQLYDSMGYGHQQQEQPINTQDFYRTRDEVIAQQQQMPKIPALKQQQQYDNMSQSSLNTTGSSKKTVTFNENVGVNEYPALRSYGSTSSDGSLVQQFDQSYGGSYSDDQSPNSTFERNPTQPTFLPKLTDHNKFAFKVPTSQVPFEYKPKYNPNVLHPSGPANPALGYPYRPAQQNQAPQVQQQPQPPTLTYPYRPPQVPRPEEAPNPRNQLVQGRRHQDPTYGQRVFGMGNPVAQENPYSSRNRTPY